MKKIIVFDGTSYMNDFDEPKITQQILDKGLILGFYRHLGFE